jgi:hypothetical protein
MKIQAYVYALKVCHYGLKLSTETFHVLVNNKIQERTRFHP